MTLSVYESPSPKVLLEPLTGRDFFDSWKTARLADKHRKPMGATGLQQAEFLWRKWLAFCSTRQLDWQSASAVDFLDFGSEINPRKIGAASKVSPVTLRRYWRILNDLYAYAVLTYRISENPASDAMPEISERTDSLALPPHMWALLQEGLPGGHTPKDRRNLLVLLLIMRCANTVSEISSLKISSVEAHEGTPQEVSTRLAVSGLPLLQPESPFCRPLETHPVYVLQLSGSRPVQTRRLVLDPRTSKAVHDWLEIRKLGKATAQDKLIVGAGNGAAVTPKSLYNICQSHMQRCLQDYPTIAQMGPNTLRNTCISIWLNQGDTVEEILRRCGLKDQGVLIRLQKHINPTVTL